MTPRNNLPYLFFGASMLAAVALAGCSSSKDDDSRMTGDGTGMTGGDTVMPLTIPAGLAASTAEPVHATDEDDTVAMLLPDSNNQFAPLSSTLQRTFSGEDVGTSIADDFHVKTISGDGANGFNVTYVVGDEERMVHFGADGFDTADCRSCYYVEDQEGRRYWFGEFNEVLDYADVYGGSFPGGSRPYFIFGARTESGNLPIGSVSYFGRMYVQAYKQDDPDNDQRVEMDGRIVLTADLDESTLDGVVQALRSKPRGGQWSGMSDTSAHFDITDGRMVDGQFTATLTGVGDQSAAADETVHGYEGSILGEFYGPTADEVGGVVSATSDVHDRVLAGHFGGERLNSTSSDELPAVSMATFVDRPGSAVSLSDRAGVTGVQRDGVGGFHVTYTVGGTEQAVHLEATDLASYPGAPYSYHERVGNHSYFLWDVTRSFYTDPEFDHFNANGWAVTDWADEGYDFGASTSLSGYLVHGTPTAASDLPTGTASYSGRAFAQLLPSDDTASSARTSTRGRLTLNADFGASTIGGMIDQFEIRPPGQSSYTSVSSNNVTELANGTISDNRFTADLTSTVGFSGNMTGHFYGPAAEEVGGVWQGTNTVRNTVARGYFGGSKQ